MELGKCNIEIKRVKDEQIKLYIITLLAMIFFWLCLRIFFYRFILKKTFFAFLYSNDTEFMKANTLFEKMQKPFAHEILPYSVFLQYDNTVDHFNPTKVQSVYKMRNFTKFCIFIPQVLRFI